MKKSNIGIEGDNHLLNGMLVPIDWCFKKGVDNVVQQYGVNQLYVAYSEFIHSTYMYNRLYFNFVLFDQQDQQF